MPKIFYIFILLTIIFTGCEKQENISDLNLSENLRPAPEENSNKELLEKDKMLEKITELKDKYKKLGCMELEDKGDNLQCVKIHESLNLLSSNYNKIKIEENIKNKQEKNNKNDTLLLSNEENDNFNIKDYNKGENYLEKIVLREEIEKLKNQYEKLECNNMSINSISFISEQQSQCMKIYDNLSLFMYDYKKIHQKQKDELNLEIAKYQDGYAKLGCKGDLSETRYSKCIQAHDKLRLLTLEYVKLESENLTIDFELEKDIKSELAEYEQYFEEKSIANKEMAKDSFYQQEFIFEHKGKNYLIKIDFSKNKFTNYQVYSKSYTYYFKKPPKWQLAYYEMFVFDGDDDAIIKQTINAIKSIDSKMTNEELMKAIVSFVQNIPYDWQTYYIFTNTGHGFMKYPYETLAGKTGMCGDKSILLSRLLAELNYKTAIFIFPKANHGGVGIGCESGYDNYKSGYCYIESTGILPIGEVPETLGPDGEIKLDKTPVVLDIATGNNFSGIADYKKQQDELIVKYGKGYFGLDLATRKIYMELTESIHKLEKICEEMEKMEKAFKSLRCNGKIAENKIIQCNNISEKIKKLNVEEEQAYYNYSKKDEEFRVKLEEFYLDIS